MSARTFDRTTPDPETPDDARHRLPVLLFLHLPRTAGTTFNGILWREYEDRALLKVAQGLFMKNGTVVMGENPLDAHPAERRSEVAAVAGHMSFGLDELIDEPCTYVTMLREPIGRVISLYQYIADQPHHPHYPRIVEEGWDLSDFLTHDSPQFNNGQLRMLTGLMSPEDLPVTDYDEALVQRAIGILDEHFSLVGTTDRFDDFLVMAWRRFRWHVPLYRPNNISSPRLSVATMDPETLELAERMNAMDRALYDYANARLDQEIARAGEAFHDDRAVFRLLNFSGGRT